MKKMDKRLAVAHPQVFRNYWATEDDYKKYLENVEKIARDQKAKKDGKK